MKPINRLETAWSPKWDLGLQDEFRFASAGDNETGQSAKPSGWSRATAEVMDRQVAMDRRLGHEPNRVGALIAYFETLFGTED